MAALPPIIFEDECLIAFDKPAGLAVAADFRRKKTGPDGPVLGKTVVGNQRRL